MRVLPLFLIRLNILCWTESCLWLKFAQVYKGSTGFCWNSGEERLRKWHQILIIPDKFVSARTKIISIPLFRLGWLYEQCCCIQVIRFHEHPTPANYFLFLLLCCRWEPDGSGSWVLSECFHYLKCQITLRVAHVLVLNWTRGILQAIKWTITVLLSLQNWTAMFMVDIMEYWLEPRKGQKVKWGTCNLIKLITVSYLEPCGFNINHHESP